MVKEPTTVAGRTLLEEIERLRTDALFGTSEARIVLGAVWRIAAELIVATEREAAALATSAEPRFPPITSITANRTWDNPTVSGDDMEVTRD